MEYGKPTKETELWNEKKAKNKMKDIVPGPAKQAAMKNIFSSSVFQNQTFLKNMVKNEIKKPKIGIFKYKNIIEVKTDNFSFNNDGKVEDSIKNYKWPVDKNLVLFIL